MSESQQPFFTKTAICSIERWKNSMGHRFVPECNHALDSHICQYFSFSGQICRTTICWDPDILIPWQREEMTSPLYWDIFLFTLSSYCKLRPSGVKSRKNGEARRELYICLLSNFFCIILNLYRNPLLASFIDKYYSPRSAAYSIIFTSLRRAHCRLSNYHDSCRIKLRIWIWTTWSNVHFNWCLLLTICTEKEVASYQLYPC